jgi:hypothetical protein
VVVFILYFIALFLPVNGIVVILKLVVIIQLFLVMTIILVLLIHVILILAVSLSVVMIDDPCTDDVTLP